MSSADLCFKCKKNPGCFASRDGVSKMYCEHCFTEFCTKTTREQLFSHCYLPCDEPVAVGVSGGPHSLFLLHQLGILRKQGELRQGAGAVNFELLPFHLREDELVLPPPPPESSLLASSSREGLRSATEPNFFGGDAAAHAQRRREILQQQFNQLETQLQELQTRWEYANCLLFGPGEMRVYAYSDFLRPQELQVLRYCVHHPRLSLTQREELYGRVRQRVLGLAARHRIAQWRRAKAARGHPSKLSGKPAPGENGAAAPPPLHGESGANVKDSAESSALLPWDHLVVGDSVIHCCIAALTAIVQGGTGEHIVHQSSPRGFLAGIVVLRPLRVLLTKEVILYNRLHGIVSGYTPALRTATSLPSIHRVLEQFVHSLVSDYWTSAFNVLNTVRKIAVEPPAVAAVLEGLAPPSLGTSEHHNAGAIPTDRPAHPLNQQKGKKKFNALGRSAQLYYAQLQRTEPPPHRVCRRAVEGDGIRSGVPLCVNSDLSAETADESNAIGSACFVCGCPFVSSHEAAVFPERVVAPVDSEGSLSPEGTAYEYYVCHGCHGCLQDVLASTTTPPAATGMSGEKVTQLLSVLAGLASSPLITQAEE